MHSISISSRKPQTQYVPELYEHFPWEQRFREMSSTKVLHKWSCTSGYTLHLHR
jgi:hypothetical protein